MIVLGLKFIDKPNKSAFNKIHMSFWPRIDNIDSKNLSKKKFSLFQKGSIHIVLENVKGILDKGVYVKLRLNSSKKFYIATADINAIKLYEKGENILEFIKLILNIINSTSKIFFPSLGAKRKKKTKKIKKKTKKSKKKSRKR